MKAPFPWFGGKRPVASIVWERFGDVPNYVEPFFGSGAVLLNRPGEPGIETVNDKDGYVSNFWRSLKFDPEKTAHYADWPVNENDLHARHIWLVNQKGIVEKLEGDPDFYDAKIAGWWVWGMACWIGGGFCSGNGPWGSVDGQRVHLGDTGRGVMRQLVHLADAGRGVMRKLVHLGDAGQGVNRQLVHLGDAGRGVKRQRVHLGNVGQGIAGDGEQGLYAWFEALSKRLERVRVCCGDWQRVCGPSPTIKQGLTGLFFDPPYSDDAGRDGGIYSEDSLSVAHDVWEYCVERGDNSLFRIALCGYVGEHEELRNHGWTSHFWTAHGGYANIGNGVGKENRKREVIWFSPHCLPPQSEQSKQYELFENEEGGYNA